ncbi:MAG: hypothetical protein ACO1SX_22435 [Actinomycetota bacterium]
MRLSKPHPILESAYYSLGIKLDTIVYNHLNQPRELIRSKIVEGIFG